jgi:hypothetical protein
VAIARYRLTEASKLQILAALAAAKGQGELAADILGAARILLGSRERSSDGLIDGLIDGFISSRPAPDSSPGPAGARAPLRE